MIDRTGKFLLALIAFGLWANVGVAVLHSTSAMAQDCNMSNVESYLQRILNRVGDIGDHMPTGIGDVAGFVSAIATGNCTNSKICAH
jgi:hypothetical protein